MLLFDTLQLLPGVVRCDRRVCKTTVERRLFFFFENAFESIISPGILCNFHSRGPERVPRVGLIGENPCSRYAGIKNKKTPPGHDRFDNGYTSASFELGKKKNSNGHVDGDNWPIRLCVDRWSSSRCH